MEKNWIRWFSEIGIADVPLVGGKNASLGEMRHHLAAEGIRVPDGFATTTDAFFYFLEKNGIREKLDALQQQVDTQSFSNLTAVSAEAKALVMQALMPDDLRSSILSSYEKLCGDSAHPLDVAVRSSASAEDLPTASFAGQHESFLNIRGGDDVVVAVQKCYASLYNARAIKYRFDNGFEHGKVALSAGIQRMVRSDLSSSGVAFTIEPETGFQDLIVITGCWGLGENIVQGAVTPDEFVVFKPSLHKGLQAIISKKTGAKQKQLVYAEEGGLVNLDTSAAQRKSLTLTDAEVTTIALWCSKIEAHYGMAMDVEWAKDGISGELFIVQARPETIHAQRKAWIRKEYTLQEKGSVIVSGNAVGEGIASGRARILHSPKDAGRLQEGEILITEITNPDWDPILKKAGAIVTDKGGRTSHAAIVAREVGAVAIVGATDATKKIQDGDWITVSTAQGKTGVVYQGALTWTVKEFDLSKITLPSTNPMLILADPEKAFQYAFYPNQGVGLMRLEFVINKSIRIHPMALVHPEQVKDPAARAEIDQLTEGYADKKEYFVDKLSQAVATMAAAFYPKDVIVRMSDFKTNEYANLLGGKTFEFDEENPMIGFRGASRYYHDRYREGFRLECEAMKRVRNTMGLTNVKLMIPFCRTVEEGKKVVNLMESYGLKRGDNGLEIYVMAEIPSNVLLADAFAEVFDGFSIGSNDLTQLTLGIDRDSEIIAPLFDENNAAVKMMIAQVIRRAKACGVKIGLCGQAPSDNPEFAAFLIDEGIDAISFNPDALLNGITNMCKAEESKKQKEAVHQS